MNGITSRFVKLWEYIVEEETFHRKSTVFGPLLWKLEKFPLGENEEAPKKPLKTAKKEAAEQIKTLSPAKTFLAKKYW